MKKIALAALALATFVQSSFAYSYWTNSSLITQVSAFSGCNENAGKEVLWVTQASTPGQAVTTYFATSADAGYAAIKETVMQSVIGKQKVQLWTNEPGKYTISLNSGDEGCAAYSNFRKIFGASIQPN